jgi:enoyl-CoA hydratase/carnithine racemase
MDYETIAVDRPDDDRIARIRLDRPEQNNVITARTLDELTVAVTDADRDGEVGGILLGSTEPPFCSGASLEELNDLSWEEGARWMTAYFETLDLLRDTGKPVVAAADLLGTILDEKSPQAYRTIKAIMKRWTNFGLVGQEMARDLTARVWDSPEFSERAEAFLAREEQQARRFEGTRPRETDAGSDE